MNEVAMPFVALVFFVAQGFMLTFATTELVRYWGPRAVRFAVVAAVILAAVAGYFWTSVLNTSVAFTILASALTAAGMAMAWAGKMKRDIADQLRMASTVARFGLENFNQFDTKREGEFGSAHLENALSTGRFTGGGEWLIKHMQARISDIGHQADVVAVPIPVHSVGVVVIHRINRRDLETYENRIYRKYRAWL